MCLTGACLTYKCIGIFDRGLLNVQGYWHFKMILNGILEVLLLKSRTSADSWTLAKMTNSDLAASLHPRRFHIWNNINTRIELVSLSVNNVRGNWWYHEITKIAEWSGRLVIPKGVLPCITKVGWFVCLFQLYLILIRVSMLPNLEGK